MLFTLRQLEIFLAVAKHQNISRAAEHLCMSQSAASTALHQLESQFDLALFNRTGKSLSLNKTGEEVRSRAQSLMDNAIGFQEFLKGQDELGHLNVGASITIGNYLGVKYFSDYLARYPDSDANFQIANSPEIVKKVINFELDIGLVEAETRHPDLRLISWREDRLVAFCSPKHPLASKAKLTKSDLKQARWILREADSGTRQSFDREMHGLLPELNIFLELAHNEAIKRAVEANIGIGCLSEIAVEANLKRGDFVPLNFPGIDFSRRFYFALNKNRPLSKAVETWMQLCRGDSN